MKCFFVLLVLPCVFGASVNYAKENLIETGRSEVSDSGSSTWKVLNKVMADCNNDDFGKITNCLGEFSFGLFIFFSKSCGVDFSGRSV